MFRVRRHLSNVPTAEVANHIRWQLIQRHPLARSRNGIAFRRLSRHSCHHDCFLRRYPKIPRRLQGTPDIGIFRAAIESNELHTVRALYLIAVAESLRPLAERLAAFGTENFYPVGHENLPQGAYQAVV